MPQPRIFVSHSHKDENFTQRLLHNLHRAGAEVWVDVNSVSHGNFMERIDEGLARCDWLVLVLTPNSIDSKYVKDEVFAALLQVKQGDMRDVIPMLAAPCAPGTIPPLWNALHRYDATQDYGVALAGVLNAVGLPQNDQLLRAGRRQISRTLSAGGSSGQQAVLPHSPHCLILYPEDS